MVASVALIQEFAPRQCSGEFLNRHTSGRRELMNRTRRTFVACAASSALLGPSQARAQGSTTTPTWRVGAEAPFAVQEIYPVLHQGEIWIAGGFAPQEGLVTQRVIVLDPASNRWRDGPPLPTRSHHVHLASVKGRLWAIGGFIPQPGAIWHCTARVLKLDGEQWAPGPDLPKPIGEAAPIVHDNRIHLIGGRSPAGAANANWNHQVDMNDHFVLADGASEWERARPLPMARNSTASAVLSGELHVISGRTVAGGETGAHHIYDPRTDSWREGIVFPEPRGGIAATLWRGGIVAGGGEIFRPRSVGDSLYAFNPRSGWLRFETMPTPRHGHGLVAAGEALYAVGGARLPSADGTLANVDVLMAGQ
jgi:hypothetical protein